MNFGVIRYAPMTGVGCDQDKCAFDGWYSSIEFCKTIAEDWTQRYSGWVICVVERKFAHWPKGKSQ